MLLTTGRPYTYLFALPKLNLEKFVHSFFVVQGVHDSEVYYSSQIH